MKYMRLIFLVLLLMSCINKSIGNEVKESGTSSDDYSWIYEALENRAEVEAKYEEEIAQNDSLSAEEIEEMRSFIVYLKELATWPRTLDEAVDNIVSTMPEKDVLTIMSTPRAELSKYHYSLGAGIRNSFGLWKGNPKLIESACGVTCDEDTASMKIIESVWDKLHNQKLQNIQAKNTPENLN